MSSWVLGVDACGAGWVGVVLHHGVATVRVAKTVAALVVADVETDGCLAVIGIEHSDRPTGHRAARQADVLAYKLVGLDDRRCS
jgi:hypothetical protein